MKNEFTPYEQALDLKELGFDEPCFGYYLCKNSALGVELELTTNWIDLFPYDSSSCKAPLYQQAFRFFREKYEIDVFYWRNSLTDKYRVSEIKISNKEINLEEKFEDTEYKTYEEAELACLIKLIEILKDSSTNNAPTYYN